MGGVPGDQVNHLVVDFDGQNVLLSRIFDNELEAGVKDVSPSDYPEVLEPLTGQEVGGARAEHIVDGLLQLCLDDTVCWFECLRQEGTLQVDCNIIFGQLDLIELLCRILPLEAGYKIDHIYDVLALFHAAGSQ